MSQQFSLSEILFLVVILQLLGMSAFLFAYRHGKKSSNVLLGSYFLLVALNLTDIFMFMEGVYQVHPNFAFWSSSLPFLFGPLLYLSTQSILTLQFDFRSTWVHLIPFVMVEIATEVIYLSMGPELQQTLIHSVQTRDVPWYFHVGSGLGLIQFSAYVLASFRLIQVHKRKAREKYSNYVSQDISWLQSFLLFWLLLMLFSTVTGFMAMTSFGRYYLVFFAILLLTLFIYIFQIVFKALQRSGFYPLVEENSQMTKSRVADPEEVLLIERLRQWMKDEKPYLNPDLTLEDLAGQLNIKGKALSIVLNEKLGQNFFDFVNRYRIEDAKVLLAKSSDSKILGVLMDAGFNSKSSFNHLFKKYTGKTPSEFRKLSETGQN